MQHVGTTTAVEQAVESAQQRYTLKPKPCHLKVFIVLILKVVLIGFFHAGHLTYSCFPPTAAVLPECSAKIKSLL